MSVVACLFVALVGFYLGLDRAGQRWLHAGFRLNRFR
jgi:hypothetical protein